MDRTLGLPLSLIFEDELQINGSPVQIQLPTGWRGRRDVKKKDVFNSKIKILSIIAKREIPQILENRTLLVVVDELPPISMVYYGDIVHAETLTIPVLSSLHFVKKLGADTLKIKLIGSDFVPLWPENTVQKLTVALRSFPYDTTLSEISLRLHFQIQLFESM